MRAVSGSPVGFNREDMKLQRVEVQVLHASVDLRGTPIQGGAMMRFPTAKLTDLYGAISQNGFDSFQLLPNGARMSTPPLRELVTTLEQTTIWEELGTSGAALETVLEVIALAIDQVREKLPITEFGGLRVKLIAHWPVPGGNAVGFMAHALRLSDTALASLGSEFVVAGVRFNRVEGRASAPPYQEWDVRVEPLLRQRDRLWVEVEARFVRPLAGGREIAQAVKEVEQFARTRVVDAVLAMYGNQQGGTKA